jgi:CRISPR system Cascade subunit CasE
MHGFAVVDATATQLPPMFVRRPAGERGFSLDRTRYTGRLRVTDSEKFTEALRSGVGRGRAFGNGLLFVAAGTA